MLLACAFFLLPGSAEKQRQNRIQSSREEETITLLPNFWAHQSSRGTEGHRKTTQSSVRLLENCLIMVLACWGYILWYRLVQVPLMLWRPFPWESSMGVKSMFSCRALGNAWAWRPHICEICLAWGTESLSGGAERRGVQVVGHQEKWKGSWGSLHWKLPETIAWAIQRSKGDTVWGHGQTSSGGSRWRNLEVYEFWFLLHLQICNFRRLFKVDGESLRIMGYNAQVLL